jgi:hypothetical protein
MKAIRRLVPTPTPSRIRASLTKVNLDFDSESAADDAILKQFEEGRVKLLGWPHADHPRALLR